MPKLLLTASKSKIKLNTFFPILTHYKYISTHPYGDNVHIPNLIFYIISLEQRWDMSSKRQNFGANGV